MSNALTGRSHRSVECKERLKEAIDKSKDILKLPDDYLLGIMPGSNTGALEAAMWCLLGKTGVDIISVGSITNSVKGIDMSLEI